MASLPQSTFTWADVATAKAALASGALRVRFADGREVIYQTTQALIVAIQYMERELARFATATPVPRMTRVVHSRS